jgi:sugar/nucleoside kinase (ribokinase family)
MKQKIVACMGDCNIDTSVPIKKLPIKGGCTHTDRICRGLGGTMLNVATALSKLGIDSVPLTFLGDDRDGDEVVKYLSENGISDRGIVRCKDYMTGNTIALVEPDGEKYWIGIRERAADLHMSLEESFRDICKEADALFISGTVINEGMESRMTALELAKQCHNQGVLVFLDPNLRVLGNKLKQDAVEIFEKILPYVDVLIPNEGEVKMLGEDEDSRKAAEKVLHQGVGKLWVKCGGRGSFYISETEYAYFAPKQISVVDTTGAGDSFTAAVIYCNMEQKTIEETGKFANEYAGYSVTKYGSIEAFPGRETIEIIRKKVFRDH